jgi:DNA-directed RNA polymerase subunit RPC12/RpoP
VIKFRCPRCGQKIAVNVEGVGAVIACTTCMEYIIVPPQSTPEFQLLPVAPIQFGHDWQRSAGRTPSAVRAALLPHLARLMMDKLVQALVHQRRSLVETQENATVRVGDLERRFEALQKQLDRRLQTYERRISELQTEVALKERENKELADANMRLAWRAMELERLKAAAETESRDADFLLRA